LLEGKTAPAPFFDWKQLETTNISVKDTKSNHEESKFLPSAAYILEDAYIAIIWALFHYLLTGYNLPSQDFGSFSVVTNLRTPDGSLAFPRQSLRRAERAKTEPSGVKFKPSGGLSAELESYSSDRAVLLKGHGNAKGSSLGGTIVTMLNAYMGPLDFMKKLLRFHEDFF
jgi:hypothetical protein